MLDYFLAVTSKVGVKLIEEGGEGARKRVSVFPKMSNYSFNGWLSFLLTRVCSSQETLLLEWVNPVYLDPSYQEQIQEEFEDSSEIQLKDFLKVTSHSFFFGLSRAHSSLSADYASVLRRRSSGR